MGTKVGFTREEMFSEGLAGTSKLAGFSHHIFLAYGKSEEWPEKIPEGCPEGSLPLVVEAAVKAAGKAAGCKAKLNFVQASGDIKEGDLLVFPNYARLRVSTKPGDEGLAQLQALLSGKGGADVEDLAGSFTFICAHANRDERCGHCGPRLVAALEGDRAAGRCANDLQVLRCNHLGGHKYAGCAITYEGKGTKNDGNWYGYVTPETVGAVAAGEAARGALWRGRMGLDEESAQREHKKKKVEATLPLVVASVVIAAAVVQTLRAVLSRPR